MLKSGMKPYELVFPLKLGPLTYLGQELRPGMVVEAPLRGTLRRALVLGEAAQQPQRPLQKVPGPSSPGPLLSEALLGMLRFMAEHYMVPLGTALRAMFGPELLRPPRRPPQERPPRVPQPSVLPPVDKGLLQEAQAPGVSLLKAPGRDYEMAFLLELLRGPLEGAIILCPTEMELRRLQGHLQPLLGRRLCVLQFRQSRAQRARAYQEILAGQADVVLGSRLAVFAPLRRVSLIAVLGEESPAYRAQEAPRYSARDMAVLRGRLEGSRVLLSSPCPSSDSYAQALWGRYRLLWAPGGARAKVRVLKAGRGPLLRSVLQLIRQRTSAGQSALVLAQKEGHSVPLCEDCGFLWRCPGCEAALVLHSGGKLCCSFCGHTEAAPLLCARCKGHRLKPLGAGTERLAQELRRLFPQATVAQAQEAQQALIVVSTRRKAKKALLREATLAVLTEPEAALLRGTYKARELFFQELYYLAESLGPEGLIILQSLQPRMFEDFKELSYEGFMRKELAQRKALGYPPYGRLVAVHFKGPVPELGPMPQGVQCLGTTAQKDTYRLLLKAPGPEALRKALKEVFRGLRGRRAVLQWL